VVAGLAVYLHYVSLRISAGFGGVFFRVFVLGYLAGVGAWGIECGQV